MESPAIPDLSIRVADFPINAQHPDTTAEQHVNTVSIPSCAGFLDIPGEIRNKIYGLTTLVAAHPIIFTRNSSEIPPRAFIGNTGKQYHGNTALLRVSKQVSAEVASFLYSGNAFDFGCRADWATLSLWLFDIGLTNRKFVRRLAVPFTPEHLYVQQINCTKVQPAVQYTVLEKREDVPQTIAWEGVPVDFEKAERWQFAVSDRAVYVRRRPDWFKLYFQQLPGIEELHVVCTAGVPSKSPVDISILASASQIPKLKKILTCSTLLLYNDDKLHWLGDKEAVLLKEWGFDHQGLEYEEEKSYGSLFPISPMELKGAYDSEESRSED